MLQILPPLESPTLVDRRKDIICCQRRSTVISLYATFNNRRNVQLLPDLRYLLVSIAIVLDGGSRDDLVERRDGRQSSQNVIMYTVNKNASSGRALRFLNGKTAIERTATSEPGLASGDSSSIT